MEYFDVKESVRDVRDYMRLLVIHQEFKNREFPKQLLKCYDKIFGNFSVSDKGGNR